MRPEKPNNLPNRPAVWWHDWVRAIALVVLVGAAYQQVWHAGFIWDDDAHLTKNVCIVGPAGFKEIWTTSEATYYPLVLSTFWVLHKFVGLNPLPYHLTNVLAHALAAVLLWRVLRLLRVRGAWFGAALWAVHPVMVQSVAWVTELKNTQSCVFYLLCVLAFLRSNSDAMTKAARRWWYAGALLFCAMAIASKSSTVVLPAVLALCLWWRNGRIGWRDLLSLSPFFVMTAAASGWTIWEQKFHSGASGAEWGQGWLERVAIAGHDFWFYLSKLAWPDPLMFIYPRWQIDTSRVISYLPTAGAMLALLWCWWKRNGRWRPAAFAAAYFIIALAPVLGFFDVFFFRYSFVSDHFQYLASMGPLALGAAAISHSFDRFGKWKRMFASVVCGLLLLGLATLTWRQSRIYADADTLWRTTLARNPACWMAHYELARPLRERGETDQAIAEYERGLAIWPDYAAAHYNVAGAYLDRGDSDQAISHYETALRLDPNDAETHNNLGNVLKARGEITVATAHYEQALKLRPDYAVAEYNLGNTLLITRDVDAALAHFRRAAELAPRDAELHLGVANAFLKNGQTAEAIAQYQKTVELAPHHLPALTNLAWALSTAAEPALRDGGSARKFAEEAVRLSGGNQPMVLHSLAAAFAETGEFSRAIETAEHAIEVAEAQGNYPLVDALRAEAKLYRAGEPSRAKSF